MFMKQPKVSFSNLGKNYANKATERKQTKLPNPTIPIGYFRGGKNMALFEISLEK